MDARIGSQVVARVDPRQNKGLASAAAVVTRLIDKDEQTVNLRVFLDTGMDLRLTSIKVLDSEPDEDDKDVAKDISGTQQVAWFAKD